MPSGQAGAVATATGGAVLLATPAQAAASSAGADGSEAAGGACAATTARAELRPVYLAFALDVSGSMGKLDYEWHDPTLKWEPVVAATKAFFSDPASAGLHASLTFFPAPSDRCEPSSYLVPEVPMTELPAAVFATAIDEATPQSADDWLGGTPSLAVVEGTIEMLESLAAAEPDSTYAIVLVTDGYPNGCDDESIESVAAAVQAVANRIPTYVIGVRNPPIDDAPDTVSDLQSIAEAGGTEQAFFIETGDPQVTTASFLNAVNGIRGQALSCDIEIPPPPPGEELDAQRVAVKYTSGATVSELAYNPDCTGGTGWHYDNPAAPATIQLCPDTCTTIQSDPAAELGVEFACEVKIPLLY